MIGICCKGNMDDMTQRMSARLSGGMTPAMAGMAPGGQNGIGQNGYTINSSRTDFFDTLHSALLACNEKGAQVCCEYGFRGDGAHVLTITLPDFSQTTFVCEGSKKIGQESESENECRQKVLEWFKQKKYLDDSYSTPLDALCKKTQESGKLSDVDNRETIEYKKPEFVHVGSQSELKTDSATALESKIVHLQSAEVKAQWPEDHRVTHWKIQEDANGKFQAIVQFAVDKAMMVVPSTTVYDTREAAVNAVAQESIEALKVHTPAQDYLQDSEIDARLKRIDESTKSSDKHQLAKIFSSELPRLTKNYDNILEKVRAVNIGPGPMSPARSGTNPMSPARSGTNPMSPARTNVSQSGERPDRPTGGPGLGSKAAAAASAAANKASPSVNASLPLGANSGRATPVNKGNKQQGQKLLRINTNAGKSTPTSKNKNWTPKNQ